ncbi:MAG: helix-turn-helix domain-containing protein [Coprococcus phoceensis]
MKINNQKIELMAAKQGMTVTDLAKSMKMTHQNFNTVRRRGSCKAVTVVRIARALNCEPEEIIIPES